MTDKFIKPVIIAGLCFIIAGGVFWWARLPSAVFMVTIPPGASARQAAGILAESGVIASPRAFTFLLSASGMARRLKAGTYRIPARSSVFGVLNMITRGKSQVARVTIPEGFNARQVAGRLHALNVADEAAFLNFVSERNLEGYLYPDTYYFEPRSPADKVAGVMTREFWRQFAELKKSRPDGKNILSDKEIVILASIIEKEAVLPEERPLVAAVFINRLNKHWYLESCATVLCALGTHKDKLTYKDLKVDSPYNTYRHYGLPPGPICNPGKESLKAALYPAETDDMFFVAQGSGAHSFSRYYRDHLKNKQKRSR